MFLHSIYICQKKSYYACNFTYLLNKNILIKHSLLSLFAFFFFLSESKAQCTAAIGSNISPIKGCETLTVQFSDLSTGPVQNRVWDFGDGSPTTGATNPSHSYVSGVIGDTVYVVNLTIQCVSGPPSSATDTVRVYKKPKVLFTANKTTVCSISDSICFTNNSSTGTGYIYAWNLGDGFASSIFSPCHVYSTPGVYSVQLTVTSDKGCTNSTTINNFSAIASPNPDFTLTPAFGCTPQKVAIINTTDTLSSIISSRSWDFGDGSPLFTGSQPGSHTYTASGTYFIQLTATNSLGCSNKTEKALIVRTTPIASFTATTPICSNDSSLLTFTGSASSIATYNWNFSGGTGVPGSGKGPHKVNWTTAGIHTISLTVVDSGCSAVYSVPVTVYPIAVISLAVTPNDTVCQSPLTFTATPESYVSYKFYVNNILTQSSQNNVFQSSSLSDGDKVKVTAMNLWGCSNTSNDIAVHMNAVPTVTLTSSNPNICTGDSIVFTALPSGLSNYTFFDGSYNLQSGTSNSYTYSNPPNGHIVSVIAQNTSGCISNISNTIGINATPHMQNPLVNCGTTTANSIQFVWGAVNGAVSYQVSVNGSAFTTPGSGSSGLTHLITGLSLNDTAKIIVMAIGAAPCSDTTYSALATCVTMPCTAVSYSYTPTYQVCKGTILNPAISNISAAKYGVAWNGGTYTAATSFSLTAAANTTITISVIDSSQLTCPATNGIIVIQVDSIPNVTLSSNIPQDSICVGSNVVFTASPSNLTNYAFYNGSVLFQSGVSNVYSTSSLLAGNSIRAVAKDVGCTDTSNAISIAIIQPMFPPQVVCDVTTTTSVKFIWNSVIGATGYMVSVNGGPFITPSSGNLGVTHLVTGLTPGDAVSIIVKALGNSLCGNSAISVPATCFATPCAAINYTINSNITLCKGDTATLSINNLTISPYSVSWNGGATTTATTFTISPSADTLITVEVSNPNQPACVPAIKYFNIHVIDKPTNVTVVSSSVNDTICKGSLLTFTTSPAGYSNYAFYDGFLLLQYTNSNVYQTTNWINGHTITVIAENQGCVGAPSNSITTAVIDPLNVPQINCGTTNTDSVYFVWNSILGATGYQISINGASYQTPTSGLTSLSELVSGLNPGDPVTLSVIALGNLPCGNSIASATHTCYAMGCNVVSYTINPYVTACEGDTITLSVSNINVANPLISWNGNLPATDTTYSLVAANNTTISVSVSDPTQPSCVPTTNNFIVTVTPAPVITLSSNVLNDSICAGTSLIITASPAGYSNYTFYNGAATLQNSNNPALTISNISAGTYSISALSDNTGCNYKTATLNYAAISLPTIVLSSNLTNDTVCFGDTVIITASPAGYAQYDFYNGTTLLQSSSSTVYSESTFLQDSIYTISVTATNYLGCMGPASSATTFYILKQSSVSLLSQPLSGNICNNDTIVLTASPSSYSQYSFYNNASLIQSTASSLCAITSIANPLSFNVIATDFFGCKTQPSAILNFNALPTPDPYLTASDSGICKGTITTLSAVITGNYPNSTYLWSNNSTAQTVVVSPSTNTTYYFNATYNGCKSTTDSILVMVDITTPVANAGITQTICIGDSIRLNGSGGLYFLWSPSSSIYNYTMSNPYARPDSTTLYQLIVSNTYCKDTTTVTIVIDRCLTQIVNPIPQIITPNGDNSNDAWVVPDVDYFTDNHLTIYNRWNNVVFDASPYLNDWKGVNNKGENLSDGVYYYVLDLKNGKDPYVGYIVITR